MVMTPTEPDMVREYRRKRPGAGSSARKGMRKRIVTYFALPLFKQIHDEAKSRGWPLTRMVVHLCEASIEGIE